MGCTNRDYYISINGSGDLKDIAGVEVISANDPVEQQTNEYDAAGAGGWGKSCPLGRTASFDLELLIRGADPAATMAALEALADDDESVDVIFSPYGDNGGAASATEPNHLFKASVVTFGNPDFSIKVPKTLSLSFPIDGEITVATV